MPEPYWACVSCQAPQKGEGTASEKETMREGEAGRFPPPAENKGAGGEVTPVPFCPNLRLELDSQ